MPRPRKYHPVEMCVCLDFAKLVRNIKKSITAKRGKQRDEAYRDEIHKNLELFELNGQKFQYLATRRSLGGLLWYILCPKCGKPKRCLYLPNKFEDREQIYLCRDCHELRPLCVMGGKSVTYKKIIKPLKRMHVIKELLTNKKFSNPEAKSLLDEYENLEKTLKSSEEYRLWKFRIEHGADKSALGEALKNMTVDKKPSTPNP